MANDAPMSDKELATIDPARFVDPFAGYSGPLGTEDIDSEDISLPRLKLGQATSKEVKDKLVGEGDLYHSITGEVLIANGESGIIIPVCYSKEYILWRDINDGGGIFARASMVKFQDRKRFLWDKPDSVFEHKVGGKTKVRWETKKYVDENGMGLRGTEIPGNPESGPAATLHHNFVVYFRDLHQMVAMSLSRSSAKKASNLLAMITMNQSGPIFGNQFSLASIVEKSDANTYFNYNFRQAGLLLSDHPLFQSLLDLHLSLRAKGVNVSFDDGEQGAGAHVSDNRF